MLSGTGARLTTTTTTKKPWSPLVELCAGNPLLTKDSTNKEPIMWKMCPCNEVIMDDSWHVMNNHNNIHSRYTAIEYNTILNTIRLELCSDFEVTRRTHSSPLRAFCASFERSLDIESGLYWQRTCKDQNRHSGASKVYVPTTIIIW